MSRPAIYNRNYPGMKFEKGTMLARDLMSVAVEYQNKAVFLDASADQRVSLMLVFNQVMDHANRVSKGVDIEFVRSTVNYFMSINEFAPESVLKLLCSFMEAVLFKADRYSGFNNYRWSNVGSTLWHQDYSSKYDSEDQHQEAMNAIRSEKYSSQEYHRIYY